MGESASEILVVVDPAVGDGAALEKAARLAAGSGFGLRLFRCATDPRLVARLFLRPEALSAARTDFLRRCRAELEAVAQSLRDRGLRVEVEAAWDSPLHAGILRETALSRPALIVKDMAWHPPLGRGLLTGADWHLLRDCPVPLLLVKPGAWPPAPHCAAAIDPGHPADPDFRLDRRILRETGRVAGWLGARCTAVHAFLSPGPVFDRGDGGLRDAAARAVDEVCAREPDANREVVLLDGVATDVLPDFCAGRAVDVLGVGAASRTRLYEAVVGSTAELLMDRVPSDLLVTGFHRAD